MFSRHMALVGRVWRAAGGFDHPTTHTLSAAFLCCRCLRLAITSALFGLIAHFSSLLLYGGITVQVGFLALH